MTDNPARLAARALAPAAALLLAASLAPPARAATLTVGPTTQQYRTVTAAVAAARDGDTVQVQAGTYTNDFPTVSRKITIAGVNGMARLIATVAPPNGKGIIVTNTDVTLSHLELAGAKVSDGNGAGVRYQGGALTLSKCYVHDNQDGVLANAVPSGTVTILDSEFAYNGAGDGYTHGVYVNQVASLDVERSYFHDTKVGHHIKSRATRSVIRLNRLIDGANGTASYDIDLPDGGNALVGSNVIEQGAATQNPTIIHYGGEGGPYAGSRLLVTSNAINNDKAGTAVGVLNQTSLIVAVQYNRTYHLPTLVTGPNTQASNTILASPYPVNTSHGRGSPSSVATSPSPLPPSSRRLTASALNSAVNRRRVRFSAIHLSCRDQVR